MFLNLSNVLGHNVDLMCDHLFSGLVRQLACECVSEVTVTIRGVSAFQCCTTFLVLDVAIILWPL